MKIGIFSDVHSNLEALTEVLECFRQARVERLVCLGDIVGYGGSPNECCDLIREAAMHTILGNHDAAVAGRMDYSYYYDAARRALDLHASILSPENIAWLRHLPYEVREDHISYCHGAPVKIEKFDYLFSVEQAVRCLPEWKRLAQVTFIGHSHLCKAFALSASDVFEVVTTDFEIRPKYKYIISVGSVGQPRDHDNRACYTIYDSVQRTFAFKRASYDIEGAQRKIFAANLHPDFGTRLMMGV
jgi:predicted phosphodiesterase